MLLALGAIVVLAWFSARLLQLDNAALVATVMAAAVLGLIAIAAYAVLTRHRPGTEPAQRVQVADAGAVAAADGSTVPLDDAGQALNGKRWSLDVFAAIDAKRFAAVCETWFSWAGFDTRSEAHRTDEGVDIWLHAAKMPGPVAIVRCKHWLNKPVGLQEMKEFLGVVAVYKSAHGTYTTTSTYTPEALQFAKENGIDAVDGRGLLRRIQTRTRQSQQALLAVAYSGQA